MITLQGSPKRIGQEYGKACGEKIRENLSVLVWREGYEPLPRGDSDFIVWRKKQESILGRNWPWLLEEMAGVAEAMKVSFEDILLLNLRAWQYNYYGEPGAACSSFAITLEDGTVACAGAFDDPPDYCDYYCGPVCFKPDNGFGCITLPITGTSWASRTINEKGLTIGISSQLLPGLQKSKNTINQDLAIRIISQTCKTVDEVRDFCKEQPFTMNIVCVDAKGGVFCANQTAAGLFEIPAQGSAAITNHIVEKSTEKQLTSFGVDFDFSKLADEMDTSTYDRLDNLHNYIELYNGKCTAEDVRGFISDCDLNNPGSINRHNRGTYYLTFANPQNEPKTFWILQPYIKDRFDYVNDKFEQFRIS